MDYAMVKQVHMTCAALSGIFFVTRGIWMLADSPLLQAKFVKIAPHVIDTLLLISALTLVVLRGEYPFVSGWLTAKFLALILYVALGTIALKRGRTKTIRLVAFVAALLVFSYILMVAVTKLALPFARL